LVLAKSLRTRSHLPSRWQLANDSRPRRPDAAPIPPPGQAGKKQVSSVIVFRPLEEFRQSLIHAGILTSMGKLANKYRRAKKSSEGKGAEARTKEA